MRTYLNVPFEEFYTARALGAQYDKGMKVMYYDGPLPPAMRKWTSPDYSYQRWVEDAVNKRIRPVVMGPVMFTPRPHQMSAGKKILQAWYDSYPGFLIADSTGLGKTLSIVTGTCLIAQTMGKTESQRLKTLIVCPKGAMGVWSQTLKSYEESRLLRPLIINYQQLNKLLKPAPEKKTKSKSKKPARRRSARVQHRILAANGEPKIHFDVVIFDESHYLKNYGQSTWSLAAASIAELDTAYRRGSKPFVIYSSATPGSTPLNYAVMAPFLSKLIDKRIRTGVKPNEWPAFLLKEGFHVHKGKTWSWATVPWYGMNSDDPKERRKYEMAKAKALKAQDADTSRIGKALNSDGAPYICRSPSDLRGWPKQPVNPYYIEPTTEDKEKYDAAWLDFRDYIKLRNKGQSNPKSALVQNLRFRQKASLLKVPYIAEHAAELVESGSQVFIGVEFMETAKMFEDIFEKKHIPYSDRTGLTGPGMAEEERIKFQKGISKVVVCSTAEAVSFHAGETLPDGTKATDAQRITIIADIRQNPNNCLQQMGRAHRDGQNSPCEFPIMLDTVDVKIINSFIVAVRNLKKMKGDNDADYLEKIFSDID